METLSELLLVTNAQAEDSAAAIELSAHVLIHLAEFIKLTSDFVVLNLKYLSVFLKSILLSKVIQVVCP
jgi:hypothetical protein